MAMAVLHIILPLALLEIISQCTSIPEESFIQMPANLEDEEAYFYMDTRSESDPKQSETRRRSTLDKNFARFGRGDLSPLINPNLNTYDYDTPPEDNYVPRPSRSGGGSKSDHFVRFGRGGNSDFVRFGRDPYRSDKHFIRFGRSVARDKPRNKREAVEAVEKRPTGSNFVRFGRNDNFMRFGRQPEQTAEEAGKQQRQSNYKEEYLMRLLLEYLTRPHQASRLA